MMKKIKCYKHLYTIGDNFHTKKFQIVWENRLQSEELTNYEDRVENQWSWKKNLNGKWFRVNRKKKTRSGEVKIHFRASIDGNEKSCRERKRKERVTFLKLKWNWN